MFHIVHVSLCSGAFNTTNVLICRFPEQRMDENDKSFNIQRNEKFLSSDRSYRNGKVPKRNNLLFWHVRQLFLDCAKNETFFGVKLIQSSDHFNRSTCRSTELTLKWTSACFILCMRISSNSHRSRSRVELVGTFELSGMCVVYC